MSAAKHAHTAVHCDQCNAKLNGKRAFQDDHGVVMTKLPVKTTTITCSVQCRTAMTSRIEAHKEASMIGCEACGRHKNKPAAVAVAGGGGAMLAAEKEKEKESEMHKADSINGLGEQESIEWNPFKAITRTALGSLTTNPGAVADQLVKRIDASRGDIVPEVINRQGRAVLRGELNYLGDKWKIDALTAAKVTTNWSNAMRKALRQAAQSPEFFRMTKQPTALSHSPSYSDSTLSKELSYIIRHAMAQRSDKLWIINDAELALVAHTIVYDVVKRRGEIGLNFMRHFFLYNPESALAAEKEVYPGLETPAESDAEEGDDEASSSKPTPPAPTTPASVPTPVAAAVAKAPAPSSSSNNADEIAVLKARLAKLEIEKAAPIAVDMQNAGFDFK